MQTLYCIKNCKNYNHFCSSQSLQQINFELSINTYCISLHQFLQHVSWWNHYKIFGLICVHSLNFTIWWPFDTSSSTIDSQDDQAWFPLPSLELPDICIPILLKYKKNIHILKYKKSYGMSILIQIHSKKLVCLCTIPHSIYGIISINN